MATNTNFSSITDLQEYAQKHNTSLSSTLQKYLYGTEASAQYIMKGDAWNDFENMMEFYKNMVVKDALTMDSDEELDATGTAIMNTLRKLLVEYHEGQLSKDQILELLRLAYDFNLDYISKVNLEPLAHIFGIANDQATDYYKEYGSAIKFIDELCDYVVQQLKAMSSLNQQSVTQYIEFGNIRYAVLTNILSRYSTFQVGYGFDNVSSGNKFNNFVEKAAGSNVSVLTSRYDIVAQNNHVEYTLPVARKLKLIRSNGDEYYSNLCQQDGSISDFQPKYSIVTVTNKRGNNSVEPVIKRITSKTDYELVYLSSTSNLTNGMVALYNETGDPAMAISGGETLYVVKKPITTSIASTACGAIEAAISSILNAKGTILNAGVNAAINAHKILYDVEVETTGAYSDGSQKVSSSETEDMSDMQMHLVSSFNLRNINITEDEVDEWSDILEADEDYAESFQNYLTQDISDINIKIGLIYKELNQNYREAMESVHVDYLLGVLSTLGLVAAPESDYTHMIISNIDGKLRSLSPDETSYSSDKKDYAKLVSSENSRIVSNLYANPYRSIIAEDLEVIRYIASLPNTAYINVKNDINTFLTIYSKTRRVYMSRLMNKAFMNDALYAPFEKMLIGLIAIERFVTNRSLNPFDVDNFTQTDVKNFLLSYGMESLANSAVFALGMDYKKRVIRNYNELMKSKGSLNCLKKLYEIFNDEGSDELELSRYYLVKVTPTTNGVAGVPVWKFLPVDYNDDNITKTIRENISKAQSIASVTSNDEYWDSSLNDSSKLRTLNAPAIIPTKYNLLNLIESVENKYAMLEYMLSMVQLFATSLYVTGDDGRSVLAFDSKFIINDAENNYLHFENAQEVQFDVYLKQIFDLYSVYVHAYLTKFNTNIPTVSGTKKYHGFGTINTNVSNSRYLQYSATDYFTVKEEPFLEAHDRSISNRSSKELLDKLLVGYNFLSILKSNLTSDEKCNAIKAYCMKLNNTTDSDYVVSEGIIRDVIMENIMAFPTFYLSGIFDPNVEDKKYPGMDKLLTPEFTEFVNDLYNTSYLVSTAPINYGVNVASLGDDNVLKKAVYSICGTYTPSTDEQLTGIMTAVVNGLNTLKDVVSLTNTKYGFGFLADTKAHINFLLEAFRLFISYSSMLMNTGSTWTCDSKSEIVPLSENIHVTGQYRLIDNNQYDEKLVIIRHGGANNG